MLPKDIERGKMKHCRPAVEKYLFSKLYDALYAMYAYKNQKNDELFDERIQILRNMSLQELWETLSIDEKFFIYSNRKGSVESEDGDIGEEKSQVPFQASIAQISQL